MALTGLTPIQITNLNVSGIATFEQEVGVGGTLTYQDVTNVDAIGIITARAGVNVSAGQLDVGNNIKIGNAGVATAANFKTGVSNLHSVGLTLSGGQLDVGSNIKIGNAGVVTATAFHGDISNATGAAAGLGTALSSTQTSPLNKLYYTNRVLSVGSTITVDHPASATGAYTQYADILVEDNADLIVADGDDLIPDILGLGGNGTTGAGGAGRLLVDNIVNRSGSGAPTFPNGAIHSGDVSIADKIIHTGDTNTALRFPAADTFTVETGGSERLRIDSNGFLGIDNASPASSHASARNLVLGTASGTHGMTIMSGTSNSGHIEFSDGTGSDAAKTAGGIRYYHDSDYMRFNTGGGNERFRIDSDGRLIQRHSAAPYANRAATFQAPAGQTSTYIAVVNTETNGASGILFGDHVGQNAGNFDAYINYSHQYQHMQFLVGSGTERLRIKSDGDVSINDGNLIIGTSGHGIDFSATSDASGMSNELLDDYEEGSWTPTILGWDTFTHYSGSSYYAGWYVKVGNMVHCGWKIYYQNLTTPSSNAHIRISGLPYAAKTISAGPVCHVRFDIPDFSFSGYPVSYLSGNNTQLHFYKQVNGSNNITAINATGNYSNNWTMGTATYATN